MKYFEIILLSIIAIILACILYIHHANAREISNILADTREEIKIIRQGLEGIEIYEEVTR